MKKFYHLMIFCVLSVATCLAAQEVQVANLKAAPDNRITFDVSWGDRTGAWSDTVWVFIEYFNMEKQQMWRLPVSAATQTYTSWVDSQVRTIEGNNTGFYICGLAREKGTGTVSVSVTPADNYPQGGIRPCVYVTDHPPVAEYEMYGDDVTVNLTGTAPYYGLYGDGSTWTSPTGAPLTLPSGQYISRFIDATGNEGIIRCGSSALPVITTVNNNSGISPMSVSKPICYGAAVALDVTATAGIGSISQYEWKVNGSAEVTHTTNATADSYSASPTDNTTYSVTVTNTIGCTSTKTVAEVRVTDCLTVNELCIPFDAGMIGDGQCTPFSAGGIGSK